MPATSRRPSGSSGAVEAPTSVPHRLCRAISVATGGGMPPHFGARSLGLRVGAVGGRKPWWVGAGDGSLRGRVHGPVLVPFGGSAAVRREPWRGKSPGRIGRASPATEGRATDSNAEQGLEADAPSDRATGWQRLIAKGRRPDPDEIFGSRRRSPARHRHLRMLRGARAQALVGRGPINRRCGFGCIGSRMAGSLTLRRGRLDGGDLGASRDNRRDGERQEGSGGGDVVRLRSRGILRRVWHRGNRPYGPPRAQAWVGQGRKRRKAERNTVNPRAGSRLQYVCEP